MSNIIALSKVRQNLHIHANVRRSFNPQIKVLAVDSTEEADAHPLAAVIENAPLGEEVMVAPTAFVRGSEGKAVYIGNDVNIQDCVVIHALETQVNGELVREAEKLPIIARDYPLKSLNNAIAWVSQ